MRWYWVRHGPTHAKTMVGWTDLPADLSDRAQLDALDAYLPDAPVISSDLSRAVGTAAGLAGPRPRLPETRALREIHFGAWENRSFAQVEAETPDLIRAYWEQPGDVAPPGGESWHDLSGRVSDFVDHTVRTMHHDQIIAVAHMGVILSQLERALDITTYKVFAHKIDNFSVTELIWDGQRWRADVINHIP